MENNTDMDIIIQKADQVAVDMLKLLDEQLVGLGIDDENMRTALAYAIVTKMHQKIDISKIQ